MLIKVCCFSISPYDPENIQVRVQPVLHTYCIYVGQVHIYIFFFNIQDFLEDWAPQGFYI